MLRFMVWVGFSVSFPLLCYAQDRAAINGTVTDPTTALVADATVELKSTNTGLHRAVLTNDGGLYEIAALPVGSYTITIAKTGFRPVTIDQIDLLYGEARTIDAQLEVGALRKPFKSLPRPKHWTAPMRRWVVLLNQLKLRRFQ